MTAADRAVVELAATTAVRAATDMSSAVLDERLARIEAAVDRLALAVLALAEARGAPVTDETPTVTLPVTYTPPSSATLRAVRAVERAATRDAP